MGGRVFAGTAVAWAAMLPLASWAAARPAPAWLAYPFAFGVYALGSLICHQRPERSFALWSAQLPVCARCTGIYLGAAIGAVLGAVRPHLNPARQRLISGGAAVRWMLGVAAAPTIASLAFEWTTGVTPSNWIRAACGVVLGSAVAFAIVRNVN